MSGWAVVLVGGVALVVSGVLGWFVSAGALRLAARSGDAGRPAPDDGASGGGGPGGPGDPPGGGTGDPGTSDGPDGPRARQVLRGGTWIGLLERLAITASLLAGYPAGIAFVIAVKGLGRYPELREHPGSSERFVIGTLGSLAWSAALGLAGAALLGTDVIGV